MTQKNNTIPATQEPLISLGNEALTGAIAIGSTLPLAHHDAVKIRIDLYDVIGDPAQPPESPDRGKLLLYKEKFAMAVAATGVMNTTVKDGRDFCRLSIAALRPTYGAEWNANWRQAGFNSGSLAVPSDPVPMLLELAEYYRLNTAREVAAIQLTAVRANALVLAINNARQAAATARANRVASKRELDLALTALRRRLSGLRRELGLILDDDDERWYQFGFIRPIDGHLPEPVSEITLRLGQPGEVIVEWPGAVRATGYRVEWRLAGTADEPAEVGLFTDRQVVITGLPHGANITVSVSAYNSVGEAAAVEVTITVG